MYSLYRASAVIFFSLLGCESPQQQVAKAATQVAKSNQWGPVCQSYRETVTNDCTQFTTALWPQVCPVYLESLKEMQSSLPPEGVSKAKFDAADVLCEQNLTTFRDLTKNFMDFPRVAVQPAPTPNQEPVKTTLAPEDDVVLVVPSPNVTIKKTITIVKPSGEEIKIEEKKETPTKTTPPKCPKTDPLCNLDL